MSFKDKMHPSVSNAEIEVFKELSRRGLTDGMLTQVTITLKATRPDFAWYERKLAVYLDGEQVHRKRREKDEEIDNLMEICGWRVLRLSYEAPLTKLKLTEITDQIQTFIRDKEDSKS